LSWSQRSPLETGARVVDAREREPVCVWRDRPQQHHRDGDEGQHRGERREEASDRERAELTHRPVQKRVGHERDGRERRRREQHDHAQATKVATAIGEPTADRIAHRQRDQHGRDRVRPDDRRSPEVGSQQPGGRDLGTEAPGADDERERADRRHRRHATASGSRVKSGWRRSLITTAGAVNLRRRGVHRFANHPRRDRTLVPFQASTLGCESREQSFSTG
jgi:predicted RNA binding protein YcfA (HicA-like mRNA interferase family)